MAKSILQSDKECYLCRKRYNLRTTRSLEEHHILFGRGRRELSERYGLKVWLCHNHHNEPHLGVHFDPAARRVLEQAAQFAFDELHGPGSFAEVFGEEIQEDTYAPDRKQKERAGDGDGRDCRDYRL